MDLTGLGTIAGLAKGVMNRFWPEKMDEAEKAKMEVALTEAFEKREASVLDAQKGIIVAEMQQSDLFTKRARPAIVYFGLAAIGLVHVLLPMTAWVALMWTGQPIDNMPNIELPSQFWMTWGGVCSIWIIGRSVEKRGITGKAVSMIMGGKQ